MLQMGCETMGCEIRESKPKNKNPRPSRQNAAMSNSQTKSKRSKSTPTYWPLESAVSPDTNAWWKTAQLKGWTLGLGSKPQPLWATKKGAVRGGGGQGRDWVGPTIAAARDARKKFSNLKKSRIQSFFKNTKKKIIFSLRNLDFNDFRFHTPVVEF